VTATQVVVAIVIGFGLRSLVDVVVTLVQARPRRFHLPRDYFDPCGPECKAKRMTRIGWRERTSHEIARMSTALRAVTQRYNAR
jgi:hypothetical protein